MRDNHFVLYIIVRQTTNYWTAALLIALQWPSETLRRVVSSLAQNVTYPSFSPFYLWTSYAVGVFDSHVCGVSLIWFSFVHLSSVALNIQPAKRTRREKGEFFPFPRVNKPKSWKSDVYACIVFHSPFHWFPLYGQLLPCGSGYVAVF